MQTRFVDVMSPHVFFIDINETIPFIAREMMEKWTDTIFVIENGDTNNPLGVITDGIIWKLISEADPKIYDYTAREVMFKEFIVVDGNRPFSKTHQEFNEILKDSPIKRIAVKNSEGQIIGIVKTRFFKRVKRYSRTFNVVFKKE